MEVDLAGCHRRCSRSLLCVRSGETRFTPSPTVESNARSSAYPGRPTQQIVGDNLQSVDYCQHFSGGLSYCPLCCRWDRSCAECGKPSLDFLSTSWQNVVVSRSE